MTFHAPSKASFVTSLIIAVIAGLSALSPVPYITPYAIWVAILAYIVLAISSVAKQMWRVSQRRAIERK